MNDRDRLLLAEDMLNTDGASESDNVMLDVIRNKKGGEVFHSFLGERKIKFPVTSREESLAKTVHYLYKLIHPLFCSAPHGDWEKKNEKMLKQLKRKMKKEKVK
jgi:hypothetical protein